MKRLLVVLALLLASASIAHAQGVADIRALDTSTGAPTDVGDNTNHAIRVNLIASSPTIAISGTVAVSNLPTGSAGSPSTSVLTVQGIASMTALKVDGSAVTQPVNGTVTADTELPAAAALANATANPTVPGVGAFNLIYNGTTWDRWTGAITGTVTANAGTNMSTAALAVETGGNLASIKTDVDKIPSQGQALAAASLPVVLTAAQVTTLTPPAAITGFSTSTKQSDGSQKTQLVDGSGNVIASTSNNLNVQCANCSGSGASAADNATVTESTSTFAPAGGEFQTTPGTVTTGHQSMVAITAHRAFQTSLFDASGNALLGSKVSASSIPVVVASDQGALTVAQATGSNLHVTCDSGCSSSAGFADNSAFTFGTTAINPIGGVLDDTSTNSATENSAAVARITAKKALHTNLRDNSGNELGVAAAPLQVSLANTASNSTAVKVDGSAVTQPVSAASLPLPTGAATAAKQPALGTAGSASADVISVQGIASMTALKVDPSAVTSPVSAASLPLPTGASTAAKQPALGTAGTAASDVITVQGIASMTALKVDGSAVTQPASIADGSLTTLGAKADAKSTATDTTAITAMQVLKEISAMEQAPASRAVTNAGTFAVQNTQAGTASQNVAQLAGTTTDTNSGTKSAGTLRVVLATDQPALTNQLLVTPDSVALPSNQSVNVSQMNGVTTSMNTGSSDTGTQRIVPADGRLECVVLSTASTNSTSCKGSAGNFFGYDLYNTTTTVYYLRLYNASAAPTCSSATGFIRTIPIPPAGAAGQVGGAILALPAGVAYGTGIGYCITGGSTSTDNTSAAAGVFGSINYR